MTNSKTLDPEDYSEDEDASKSSAINSTDTEMLFRSVINVKDKDKLLMQVFGNSSSQVVEPEEAKSLDQETKKFIKEEQVTVLTEAYYKTDAGLEDLVKSAYTPLQWKFSDECSYALYNFGVDEFRVGDQFNNVRYNYYDANLNSNDGFANRGSGFLFRLLKGK
jgi:hypothetical protein